ncbi:MAG: MFS transporter, partial [Pseudomonadota bacterium]
MTRRSRFFYGWIIVGITFFCTIQIYGLRHSFSVFFPYILKEFDWLRGSTALMYSMNVGVYGILATIAGTLGDRWKPKKVLVIGLILLGLATASCALALKLWHFYFIFGVLAPLGTAFCGWPILVSGIVNWFYKRRGLTMALANAGLGLSFTYGLFVELVISQVGWRWAYVVLAGILVATVLPLYLILFHHRPEEVGLTAYGLGHLMDSGELKGQNGAIKGPGFFSPSFKRTIRSYRLWFLVLSDFFYWGLGGYLVLPHQVKLAEDAGYSSLFAASIFAFFGIFMVAGQFSSAISDWIGREATATIACAVAIIGLISLTFVNDTSRPWLLYVYA